MPYIPRSVKVLNRAPYPFGKYQLGTKLNSIIEFVREMHDSMGAAGVLLLLLNDLRARMIQVITLDTELRARLHTGGDYKVLLEEIRARLILTGDIFEQMADVSDKAYNHLLTDPGWQEDAGVATDFENVAAVDAIVDGVYAANVIAAGAANATPVGWDTGVNEQRTVTLATDIGGTLSQTVSAIAVHPGPAPVPPRPPSGECPIGVAFVPPSFTSGATQIGAGGVTFVDGFPRRSDVPVVIAAPNPAVIAAAVPTAITAAAATATTQSQIDRLPDVDA